MSVEIVNILSEKDCQFLRGIFQKLVGDKYETYANLSAVVKKDISVDSMPSLYLENWKSIERKFDEYTDEKSYTHYLLLYEKGALANRHMDTCPTTIITILKKSDDLIGGENFVEDRTNERTEIGCTIGQSVLYRNHLTHGVTEVIQGKRLVLVSWYGNPIVDTEGMRKKNILPTTKWVD